MKEIDKLKAGLEYCYSDEEVYALKENAIRNCETYNSSDGTDRQKTARFSKRNAWRSGGKRLDWKGIQLRQREKHFHWRLLQLQLQCYHFGH